MKKSIIAAGAASAVLAAMPVVGVFAATTSHTDTLQLNLAEACTFGTVTSGVANDDNSTVHADGTQYGTWGTGTNANTLTIAMTGGTSEANVGTTTFTVKCNANNGFQITAKSGSSQKKETTDETNTATLESGTNYIFAGATPASFNPASDASYWNFKLQTGDGTTSDSSVTIPTAYQTATAIPVADDVVVASTSAAGDLTNGQKVTVTYGMGISNAQAAGSYSGTVTYKLVSLGNN